MSLEENLLAIRRQAARFGPDPSLDPGFRAEVARTALAWLPAGDWNALTELGGDEAWRTSLRDLNPAAALSALTRGELGPGGTFPLPDASQDLLASAFFLERLPMDQLYMALAEIRRVVKPHAYALLASLAPGENFWERGIAWAHRARGHGTPLELDHYLSPEDWEPVRNASHRHGGRRVRALLMRRLP